MDVFQIWGGSQYKIRLFIIKVIGLLGWLSGIAVAQLEVSETVTGSASLSSLGITCLGNLAVFFTSLYRGRLDLEMGARDVLATITGPNLENLNGNGLTTCGQGHLHDASVVMLSNDFSNSSISQFMKYISNTHDVESILLQCFPMISAAVSADLHECKCDVVRCGCIVFRTIDEITIMLARGMPGTLKQVPDSSFCLFPSLKCMRNGCHQGLLYVENEQRLIEGDSMVESSAALGGTHDISFSEEEHICICIPVHTGDRDNDWTNLLIRSLMFKEKEARGVRVQSQETKKEARGVRVQSQETSKLIVEYSTASLIVPRLLEILVNLLLTLWFRVDGFTSSLIARRALRDYIVDSTGGGFAANAFLTKALLNSNADNTNANGCQVLTFRGTILGIRTLSFIVGSANLICSIIWAVLIANGGAGKWYDSHSMPPSQVTVTVIMAAIGTALVMDCLDLFSLSKKIKKISVRRSLTGEIKEKKMYMICAVVIMEIVCIVIGTAVVRTCGIKCFGRWVYGAVFGLVWVKWGVGSYFLGEFSEEFDARPGKWDIDGTAVVPSSRRLIGNRFESGTLVYSSAFFLNAILAGVRRKWKYVPTEDD